MKLLALSSLSLLPLVLASPLNLPRAATSSPAGNLITSLVASNNLVTLSSSQESTINIQKAAALAGSAYCPVVQSGSWNCATCSYVPDLKIIYTGGDGTDTPHVYIGYSAANKWLVVAHQGTNTSSLSSWIDDLTFAKTPLSSSLNNGAASSSAQVHEGFQDTWASTGSAILNQVEAALKTYSVSLVLLTGHSLGAALSVLDAVYLRNHLPSTVPIQQIGFGQPRVGNSDWVNYYQSVMGNNQMRVTNYDDIVPHLPPELDSYEQPDNEIYITSAGGSTLQLCPGVENDDCSDQFIFYSESPHDGPYLGVTMDNC